jgi:hypothetical protein
MVDPLGVAAYVAATGAALVIGASLTRRLGYETRAVRYLATLLLTSAWVVVVTLALSVAGALSVQLLVVATLAAALASAGSPEYWPAVDAVRQRVRGDAAALAALLGQSRLTKVLSVLCALELAWLLTRVYLLPPISWDGLAYHLPPLVAYVQEGGFTRVGYSVFANAYPKTVEMHFLWNLVYLRDDVIVESTQLWFLAMAVITVYQLALDVASTASTPCSQWPCSRSRPSCCSRQ